MTTIRFASPFSAAITIAISAVLTAGQTFAATVDDLAWMTGSWAGPAGEQTLEENWTRPLDGSIGSIVRMRGEGATSMIELIVIEEEDDSLVLRLQQWNPGFEPRSPGPQTMKLANLGDNSVSFKAIDAGGLAALTYTRSGKTFTIEVETAEGAKFPIVLSAF